jgi:sensor histidine kinase YesM
MLAIASAVAVVFLNALAFGLSSKTVYDSLVHTFFIASLVLVFVVLAAPPLEPRPLFQRISMISAVIFAATFTGLFLTSLFKRAVSPFDQQPAFLPATRTIVFSLVISYIFGLGGYLYLNSKNKLRLSNAMVKEKEAAEERTRILATEARLSSLESRIHPHFLFNTLNSIAALIREDPAIAEQMVEQLSNILRHSLDNGAEHLTELRKEIEITRDYLDIQKLRFVEKLDYNLNIDSTLNNFPVPAFSLPTLVENSIKHVAGKTASRTSIEVSALRHQGNVVLKVTDNGEGFTEDQITKGHGLDNLRERMHSIYGNEASLKVGISSGRAKVSLTIPE